MTGQDFKNRNSGNTPHIKHRFRNLRLPPKSAVGPWRRDMSKGSEILAYCRGHWQVTSHSKLHHLSATKDSGQCQANCTPSDTDPVVGMGQSRHHERMEKPNPFETGGRAYTVWEAMLKFAPYEAEGAPTDPGAVTLLSDLQHACEKVQLTAVWNW